MRKIKFIVLTAFIPFLFGISNAQNKELNWEELREIYEFPEWYIKARIGIWTHWGAIKKMQKHTLNDLKKFGFVSSASLAKS